MATLYSIIKESIRTPWWTRKSSKEPNILLVEELDDKAKLWAKDDLVKEGYEVVDAKKGGMGVVYIVYDPAQVRYLAIKTYRADRFLEEEGQKVLEREATSWIRMPYHPNVVTAEAYTTIKEVPCIHAEYVYGQNLTEMIEKRRLSLSETLDVAVQVCIGMSHLNRHGILAHRDLSPNNILVTKQGKIKITDFGTAKALWMGDRKMVVGGTLPYMAPEQFQGIEDTRSDIYSLGIILFQALSGRLPFAAETAYEHHRLHANEPLPSLSDVGVTAPEEMNYIIHKCTSKRPRDRYADFDELGNHALKLYTDLFGNSVYRNYIINPLLLSDNNNHALLRQKGSSLLRIDYEKEGIMLIGQFFKELHEAGIAGNDDQGLVDYTKKRAEESRVAALECLKNRDYETAIEYIQRSLGEIAPIDNTLWESTPYRVDPVWKAALWLDKARAYALLGQHRLASQSCLKACEFNPSLEAICQQILENGGDSETPGARIVPSEPRQMSKAKELYYKGRVLGEQGNHAEAVNYYQQALELNPDDYLSSVECGISLNELGRFEEAIANFELVLSKDPNEIEVLQNKGFSLEKLHRYHESIECYNHILRLDPENVPALVNKGQSLLCLHNFKEAADCFEKVAVLEPRTMAGLHGLLRATVPLQDFDRAALACKALRENSEPIEMQESLKVIDYLFQQKDYLEVMDFLAYFIFGGQMEQFIFGSKEPVSPDGVSLTLSSMVSQSVDSLLLKRFFMMADIPRRFLSFITPDWLDPVLSPLIFLGKKANLRALETEATAIINQKQQQSHTNGAIRKQVKDWFSDPAKIKEFDAARSRYEKAWDLLFRVACRDYAYDPHGIAEHTFREGEILGRKGEFEAAIEKFCEGLRSNPFHYKAYNGLAISLKLLGYPYIAILCYEEALQINYIAEKTHHNLALAFMEVGRFDDAIAHFEEELRIVPSENNPGLEAALRAINPVAQEETGSESEQKTYESILRKGKEHLKNAQWWEAEQDFKKAASISNGDPDHLLQLGLVYHAIGRQSAVVATMREYLEAALAQARRPPDDDLFLAYYTLGLSYGRIGVDYQDVGWTAKAITMFHQAISCRPHEPTSHHLLGGLYLRQMRYDEAIGSLLNAIRLDPTNDIAQAELGQAYAMTNSIEKAITAFETALKLNPNNPKHLENLRSARSSRAK